MSSNKSDSLEVMAMNGCHNSFYIVNELSTELVPEKHKSTFVKSLKETPHARDGVLFLEPCASADFLMRIFDDNGDEESMCGNGIRCAAKYFFDTYNRSTATIQTLAGAKEVSDKKGLIKVNMGPLSKVRAIGSYFFTNTGCPHVVVFTQQQKLLHPSKLKKYTDLGRELSHDVGLCDVLGENSAEGVYINFVSVRNQVQVLTYERHLERITSACGTGNAAVARVLEHLRIRTGRIKLENIGGTLLFEQDKTSQYMIGPAHNEGLKRLNYTFK